MMTSPAFSSSEDDDRLWQALLAVARREAVAPDIRGGWLERVYSPLVAAARCDQAIVIGQLGQSLDGRIATVSGHSHFVNGPTAIVHLHRLRALVDAVVVGVGTAVADDPRLTVRHVSGPSPARVIIDPSGRLPLTARCLHPDGVRRIVIAEADRPVPPGVEVARLATKGGTIPPRDIVIALEALGLRRILIEGGGRTISQFLDARCLDRLHVLVAPMIIGSGPRGIQLAEVARLEQAVRPTAFTLTQFPEGDVLFDCAFG